MNDADYKLRYERLCLAVIEVCGSLLDEHGQPFSISVFWRVNDISGMIHGEHPLPGPYALGVQAKLYEYANFKPRKLEIP